MMYWECPKTGRPTMIDTQYLTHIATSAPYDLANVWLFELYTAAFVAHESTPLSDYEGQNRWRVMLRTIDHVSLHVNAKAVGVSL